MYIADGLPFRTRETRKNTRKMIRSVIIENEADAQSLLSSILLEYCPTIDLVGMAANVNDGIRLIESKKPDLVFLDIEIDGGDSFQILDTLKSKSFKIIFTTAYDQYALKAFKYEAIDYLLKPYSPQEVLNSISRVKKTQFDEAIFNRLDFLLKQEKGPSKKISIPTSEGISIFNINDIMRIEADRSYCYVCQSDGERLLVSKPLKDLEAILPQPLFQRIHSAHLINMDYVKRFISEDGGQVELTNGTLLPIARRRKSDFLKMLHQ